MDDQDEVLRIEWDPHKAEGNLEKHGVSFEEAETVFDDPLALSVSDPDSTGEFHYVTTGLSEPGRMLVVVSAHTGHTIRIISAREPTRREKKTYEEGQDSGA